MGALWTREGWGSHFSLFAVTTFPLRWALLGGSVRQCRWLERWEKLIFLDRENKKRTP